MTNLRKEYIQLNRFSITIMFVMLTCHVFTQITLVSWNIKDFGHSREDFQIEAIANIIKDVDIVSIQEVVAKHPGGAKAVVRLVEELNRKGARWDYSISLPTKSSSSYKSERYAFLWKFHKVKLKTPARLITNIENSVDREPYYASFEVNGNELNILNFHGKPINEHPVDELDHIFQIINANQFSNWVFAGDFNLSEDHIAFDQFYQLGFSAVLNDQATTLKMKCDEGKYLNNAFDNIYFKLNDFNTNEGGVLDFIEDCNLLPQLRINLSDHLPVFVQLL